MTEQPPILLLERATFLPPTPCGRGIEDVNLILGAGDLVLIRLEPRAVRLPSLADGASGLIAPCEGRVAFNGNSWQRMSALQTSRTRGKIGRVFDDGGWISSMDLAENIVLAQRHHSRRPDRQIREEADELARLVGLPGLPNGELSQVHHDVLLKAACIRAFLGRPILLLLERPTDGAHAEVVPSLMRLIAIARHRGAAILWLTAETEVWADREIRPDRRLRVSGTRLLPDQR